jgi:hypothetical protein
MRIVPMNTHRDSILLDATLAACDDVAPRVVIRLLLGRRRVMLVLVPHSLVLARLFPTITITIALH